MRQSRFLGKLLLLASAWSLPVCLSAGLAADDQPPALERPDPDEWEVLRAQDTTATQPVQPTAPERGARGGLDDLFGSSSVSRGALPAGSQRDTATATPGTSIVGGAQAQTRASSDAGDLLTKSQSTTGVYSQHRNPIVTDPRIRGYRTGQIFTQLDGGYYLPARIDLDTQLSKIDSSMISSLVVLKGPYSAQYGPAFSYFNIETAATPRYQDGMEWHGREAATFKSNGHQWSNRLSLWGGDETWGVRFGWGVRTGNDYQSGDGREVPGSYVFQDFDLALGCDLSPDSHIEFKAVRVDETGVEFAGQFLDVDYLLTNGYSLRYVLEDQGWFDRLSVDAWFNETRSSGSSARDPKRELYIRVFGPVFGPITNSFAGFELASAGYRVAMTWGESKHPQLFVGTDFRYVSQALTEFTFVGGPFQVNRIPRSDSTNPGLFVETILPANDDLTIKSGGRVDWVQNVSANRAVALFDAAGNPVVAGTFDPILFSTSPTDPSLNQDFALWSAYATAEYKWDEHWTANAGLGFAQRPPSLTELYAGGPVVATLQQGFNRIEGDPHLEQERLAQIDLGLSANYERFRGGVNGFYAWINDYITYETSFLFASNIQTTFVNTDLATLAGGEIYGEVDATDCLTPFATLSYVEGRDHTRGERRAPFNGVFVARGDQEPLPGIPPLEVRVGLRLHEAGRSPRWGLELAARIVDHQDRVAASLGEVPTSGFTVYDLRGYWQATENFLLTSGVENFTDKNYREHLDPRAGNQMYQPGVSFYLGMEYKH